MMQMKIPPITIKLNKLVKKKKKHKHKHKHHKHGHHHHHHHHNHDQAIVAENKITENKDDKKKQLDKNDAESRTTQKQNESEIKDVQVKNLEVKGTEIVVDEVKKDDSHVEEEEVVPKFTAGGRLAYLRMHNDGSTTLAIIDKTPLENETERVFNLEHVCGQLNEGTETIPSDIDEEALRDAHQVKPIDYIESSTYSSYLPVRDSTFASLTKEDTETLLEVYGSNQTCFDYAKSIQEFASGTNYCMNQVDSLLDVLTDGRHSREAVPIRQNISNSDNEIQKQLDEISLLLNALKDEQDKRLASSAAPVKPSAKETELADTVLSKLTKLIQEKAKPADITDSSAIFKALGIQIT